MAVCIALLGVTNQFSINFVTLVFFVTAVIIASLLLWLFVFLLLLLLVDITAVVIVVPVGTVVVV
jgi:hypothetical protein